MCPYCSQLFIASKIIFQTFPSFFFVFDCLSFEPCKPFVKFRECFHLHLVSLFDFQEMVSVSFLICLDLAIKSLNALLKRHIHPFASHVNVLCFWLQSLATIEDAFLVQSLLWENTSCWVYVNLLTNFQFLNSWICAKITFHSVQIGGLLYKIHSTPFEPSHFFPFVSIYVYSVYVRWPY